MSARIGVIGCGWWATRAHLPALQANPDAVIAGIADPDPENRARAAERFDDARRPGFRRRGRDVREGRARCCHRRGAARRHAPLARAVLDRGLHLSSRSR